MKVVRCFWKTRHVSLCTTCARKCAITHQQLCKTRANSYTDRWLHISRLRLYILCSSNLCKTVKDSSCFHFWEEKRWWRNEKWALLQLLHTGSKTITYTHPFSHKHFMTDYITDINSSTQFCKFMSMPWSYLCVSSGGRGGHANAPPVRGFAPPLAPPVRMFFFFFLLFFFFFTYVVSHTYRNVKLISAFSAISVSINKVINRHSISL